MKEKKGISINNAFETILDESNRKPNKMLVDKGSEFYNRSMKSRLEKKKDIKMCSKYSDVKSFVAKRFISTVTNQTYKYMTSFLQNVYIIKLK